MKVERSNGELGLVPETNVDVAAVRHLETRLQTLETLNRRIDPEDITNAFVEGVRWAITQLEAVASPGPGETRQANGLPPGGTPQ